MILPLLVFIVVLVIIFISVKTEHFSATESSITDAVTPQPTTTGESSLIRFVLDIDISNAFTGTEQTSFSNLLTTQIVNAFSTPDYNFEICPSWFLENDTFRLSPACSPQPTHEEPSPTNVTTPSSVYTIFEVKFPGILLDSTEAEASINRLKVNMFGGVNSFFYNRADGTIGYSSDSIKISILNMAELGLESAAQTQTDEYIQLETYTSSTQPVNNDSTEPSTSSGVTQPALARLNKKTLLSKNSCINSEEQCNIGYKPYSYVQLEGTNHKTGERYRNAEKESVKNRFKERCENEENSSEQFCCDPNDARLENIYSYIPRNIRNRFRNVVVDKCNNKINSIKVCNGSNCNSEEDQPRQATAYELCKLQNVTDSDINPQGVVNMDKMMPDCFEGKCEGVGKLLELNPEDQNVRITDHYYLIDAIKNNNVEYLKSYYHDTKHNVNEKLEYGYPGNTVLHQSIFDHMDDVSHYLLSLKVNLTIVNKDGNSPFHIACLKGNYDAVHKLLKLGASINCTNNVGDTPLHCAVRSGSYNTVLILLNNGASMVLSSKNEHGEIPLHTAVVSVKKNQKIVELLVEYGSPIHSTNSYKKTILGSLLEQEKTIVRETMRTFLQRMYYKKYDEAEYDKMLQKHPEVRPFEIDTEIPDNLEKDYRNYDSRINYKELIKYEDEYMNDKDLYLEKNTRALKANINSKYFDDDKVNPDNVTETFTNQVEANPIEANPVKKRLNNNLLKNADKIVMISTFSFLIVLIIAILIIYLRQ